MARLSPRMVGLGTARSEFREAFAFAQDDLNPWTFSAKNPFGKRVAQPACLANDLLWIFMTVFDELHKGLEEKEFPKSNKVIEKRYCR